MINPKPLPCPVNPPLLNSSRFWRRDKLLVSRNTCSPKSPESAERKRAPHVCALNDVQESEHAPCKICKCPHLVGCDCPCLHFQQVQRAISDASRHTGKPPVPPRLDHLSVHIQQTCKGVTICKPPSASPLVNHACTSCSPRRTKTPLRPDIHASPHPASPWSLLRAHPAARSLALARRDRKKSKRQQSRTVLPKPPSQTPKPKDQTPKPAPKPKDQTPKPRDQTRRPNSQTKRPKPRTTNWAKSANHY